MILIHGHTHGGENKKGRCARVIDPAVILRINISVHKLVNEAQCVYYNGLSINVEVSVYIAAVATKKLTYGQ